jgi:DNA-binding transcriptional LysR family regulator
MIEPDPFAGVSVFVAAARAGSFTVAADRLGLSKSAVGKAVARLEARLGVTLFHRTTRLTRLTADGEAYLIACTSAMDEVSAAQSALSSAHHRLSGRLHIDMPVAFGRRILMPLLIEITQDHPDLRLTLNFTDATSDLLQDDIDLAIRFGSLKDSSHLITRHLTTQDRVICAAPAYLSAHGVPERLEDIERHRCIAGSPKGPPQAWLVRENGTERRLPLPAADHFSDAEAMVDAAVAGLGLVQLPVSILRAHLEQGRLQQVLAPHVTRVDVHALWPRQARLRPRVRFIIDQLVHHAALGRLD